ncbi:MAG: zf-HC2 domain-containing protein [Nitrospinota bacterium]|nr:zf-HC2 domain-containing protein [Nitrospinota bacterium]
MKCTDILEKISDYLDKELDPSICKEIESHVKDCEPCIAFLNTMRKTVELFNDAGKKETEIPGPVSDKLMSFLKQNVIEKK